MEREVVYLIHLGSIVLSACSTLRYTFFSSVPGYLHARFAGPQDRGGLVEFGWIESISRNVQEWEWFEIIWVLELVWILDLVCNSMPCSAKKLLKGVPFTPWEGWRGSSCSTCVAACELVKVVGTKLPRHWTRLPFATAAEVNDGNACSIAGTWNHGHSCAECGTCQNTLEIPAIGWWTFREIEWPPVHFPKYINFSPFHCAYFLLAKQVYKSFYDFL